MTGNYAAQTYSDYIFLQMSTSQNQRFQEIESRARHVNSVFRRPRSSTAQRVEGVDPIAEAHIGHYRDIIPIPFTLPMSQIMDVPTVNAKGLSGSGSRSPLMLEAHVERGTSGRQEVHANDNALLRELNHLRTENERLREENALQNLSPPSYDS